MSERGVLLVNLGSPDSTSVRDVKNYLDEFLMDKRVIDIPYILRRIVVSIFILPFRSAKSAEAYRSIWWEQGSPLIVISQRLKELLQKKLDFPVELGMRYGNPSIKSGLENLMVRGVSEILLIPLYPHYAMSTFESVVSKAREDMSKISSGTPLKVIQPFYRNSLYIDALVESARQYIQDDFDHLLFSYHGLPERHLRKTDPTGRHCLKAPDCCNSNSPAHQFCYRHQVLETTKEFIRKAAIPEQKYSVSFQSRLGKDTWISPFTDHRLEELAQGGVKKLLVICPAFVSDCLETLEEIGIRGKEIFLNAGGQSFQMIPCLNEHPQWIETVKTLSLSEENLKP